MFLNNLKFQLGIMFNKIGFKISFSFILIMSLANSLYWAKWSVGQDISMVPAASQAFILNSCAPLNSKLALLYIFVLLLPFSFSYLTDRRNNMLPILQTRCGIKNYYFSKMIATFIGTTIIFFIPFVISIILNQVIFPSEGLQVNGSELYSYNYTATITGSNVFAKTVGKSVPFIRLFLDHPQLYNVLYAFFFAVFTGILSVFVYSLSFLIKKYSIILLFPLFVLVLVQKKVDTIITAYSPLYVNVNMRDYLMIDSFYGLSLLYFLTLIIGSILVSLLLVSRKIVKDQLD